MAVVYIPFVDAVDIVRQLLLSDSALSTPRASRNLQYFPFLAIRRFEFAHNFIANGFRHIEIVVLVFEQAKPVLTAAVSLICIILNLINHAAVI